MSVLIGKKVGMTQVYTDNGDCVPGSVIQVERCVPVLMRTEELDGFIPGDSIFFRFWDAS